MQFITSGFPQRVFQVNTFQLILKKIEIIYCHGFYFSQHGIQEI